MMLKKKVVDVTIYRGQELIVIRAECKNRIYGKMDCTINRELKVIVLNDIQCKKNNKGYGSLMMDKLIEIAKKEKFLFIEGWLSKVDMNHVDRLYHFYEKFGFQIVPNEDGMKFADIKLSIT